jgi:hypothetical protein
MTMRSRHQSVASVLLALVLGWSTNGLSVRPLQAADRSELYGKDPSLAKVSSHLLEGRLLLREGVSLATVTQQLPVLRTRRGMLEIEIRFTSLDAAAVEYVSGLGVEVLKSFEDFGVIDALADAELLDEIARMPEVTVVRPQYGAITNAGSVDNQADASINADDARAGYGIDGTGVTIGVLSDTFHRVIGGSISGTGCSRILTGSSSQSSGDLPAQVVVLDSGPVDGTDEGAAMAELMHDLATGSPLMFHSAFNSMADFAEGITDLRFCGSDVIVDDVIYFAEPMFQDGLIAQAAQAAVDAGVPYLSSAGNQATFGVDEIYVDAHPTDDTSFPPTGDDLHDFGGGDLFGSITVPGSCGFLLVLQWNQPFSGVLGPGASSDLDLYVYDSASVASGRLAQSTNAQGCSLEESGTGGDPLEIVSFTNSAGAPKTVFVAVDHFCGNESDLRFRIAAFPTCSGSSYSFEGGIFDKAQIYGHAAAAGAAAVAAVFYAEIDSGGTQILPIDQIDVEPFSSLGGDIPFFFDGSGHPLPGAPVSRTKPEFAAPDGTNTTFFGQDIGTDPDRFPNFFGTSAAAPHAAAVAALLLEVDPVLTPAGIRSLLQATASDIETVGFDFLSGAGLIDARDAVSAVAEILEVNPTSHDFGLVAIGSSASRTFTLSNTASGNATVSVSSITLSDVVKFSLDVSAGGAPCGSTSPTIAAGASCTLDVNFTPTSTETSQATLTVTSDAPPTTSHLTGAGTAGCVAPDTLLLTDQTVTTTTEFVACSTITAGPAFAVNAPGYVTFRTRDLITLQNGFSVGQGASFTAVLDPTAGVP